MTGIYSNIKGRNQHEIGYETHCRECCRGQARIKMRPSKRTTFIAYKLTYSNFTKKKNTTLNYPLVEAHGQSKISVKYRQQLQGHVSLSVRYCYYSKMAKRFAFERTSQRNSGKQHDERINTTLDKIGIQWLYQYATIATRF